MIKSTDRVSGLPDWKRGQPRPTTWPSHIHLLSDVRDEKVVCCKRRRQNNSDSGQFVLCLTNLEKYTNEH